MFKVNNIILVFFKSVKLKVIWKSTNNLIAKLNQVIYLLLIFFLFINSLKL